MGTAEALLDLAGKLAGSLRVLAKISDYYDSWSGRPAMEQRSTESAIVLSDIVVNYYTCLETVFFRVSQFFENTVDASRWHRDVLERMSYSVKGVRERVISDETASALQELLAYRHFKRYYFGFDYDWDRLELVRRKFLQVRERVVAEIEDYIRYLEDLAEARTGE